MREITLEELLQAGCHFGHQVTRQNPKARDFVYEARDNIHIIDLAKTKEGLEEAAKFVKDTAANGGTLLVVGTKRQAKPIVEEEIKRIIQELEASSEEEKSGALSKSLMSKYNLYLVNNRWIGGMLTNFFEVSKNYKKLKDLVEKLRSEEERARYTKKEVGLWQKEIQKLENFYGGVIEMKKVPTAMFVIDTHLEELAIQEAHKMGATAVGIVDTNADPTFVDYPIPANDDAVGSLKLIISYILDAWKEGKEVESSKFKVQNSETENKEEKVEGKVKEEPKKAVEKVEKKEIKKKESLKKEGENGKRKPRTTKKAA